MLQALDLVDIAATIDSPYTMVPLTSLGPVDVSVGVYEGPKTWHHTADRDELLIVMEGVVTIDGPDGTLVVNEGEVACVPGGPGLVYFSGMRSMVVLVRERRGPTAQGGAPDVPAPASAPLAKTNIAVEALRGGPFEWRSAGIVAGYAALGARMVGTSAPLDGRHDPVVMVVYRGVLDYVSGDTSGSVVGLQMLVIPGDGPVSLHSERGATVIALVRDGTPVPTGATGATSG